ncbi:MAG: hybrid sensor histidine kinase/response regulator [Phycisphaerae bacterium]|nr:hybrid sensor histidine kinase/response regulator [Phycisphaerae bacterium]
MSDSDAPSLFELFRAEVEEHSHALSDGLLALEKQSAPREAAESLMRAAHSIKGAARILGLDAVVAFAHQVEDAFERFRKGTEAVRRARIDQLLRATDLLSTLSGGDEESAKRWGEKHATEVNELLTALSLPPPDDAPAAATAPAVAATPPAPIPASRGAESPSKAAALVGGGPAAIDATAPKAAEGEQRTVRVGADHLDRMMRLAGESVVEARRAPGMRAQLVSIKEELIQLRRSVERGIRQVSAPNSPLEALLPRIDELQARARRHGESLDGLFRRSEEAATALYHEVLASRMRPFGEITGGYARMVRDLARQLGKEVDFEVLGAATPVDRDILGKLDTPLTHMIRNAVDHGIEPPAERVAAGKPARARIVVEARHQAGMLIVDVRDDGRGIDPRAVRRRAMERGLLAPVMAESLSRSETFDFLFLPGFTTTTAVTEVSGRGVGLDVVQRMVQAASGTISVSSDVGAGSVFGMRLPITLSVIRAALVEIAGEHYAVALSRLERILRVEAERIRPVEGRVQFDLDGRSVGLILASRVLDLGDEAAAAATFGVLLLEHDGHWYGLIVDRFLGEQDLVVRPLDPRLGRVPHVSAAALLDDGSVTIILDVEDLLASVRRTLGEGRGRELGAAEPPRPDVRRRRRVLVVDDSITVREVERQLLRRLGYDVETAVDGADGWNQLRAGSFDLLITDVDMPRMNGIELVRTVRREARFESLPIAIVSYKDREEDRLAGLEAGANAYLTKGSFRDESFAETVTRLAGAPYE